VTVSARAECYDLVVPAALPAHRISDPAVLAFVLIPVLLAVLFAGAVAAAWTRAGRTRAEVVRATSIAAALTATWMAATWLAAARGALRDLSATPPPFGLLVLSILLIAAWVGFGPLGRRLATAIPLWVLVCVQSFRLPLELAMHRMAERGIMPDVMSYGGYNFDIVTGATAIVVGLLLATGRAGRGLALAWNIVGLALLANVVTVAILATPRFQYFGADQVNVWVTYPPFVWLPAVMVLAALAGHLLVFRALRERVAQDEPHRSTSP
jgi:hypothetical protein